MRSSRLVRHIVPALFVAVLLGGTAFASMLPSDFGDSATAAFEGRRGDVPATELATIVNIDTAESFATIQAAIDDADTLAGHTLEVQGATHTEGQIHVTKSLTLRGATGGEQINMAVDTGNSGDNRAWFLVDSGLTVHVQDLIFDGSGHLVHQAWRFKGDGSFTGCTFREIKYNYTGPDYAGYAIACNGGTVAVTDCEFSEIGRVGVLAYAATVTIDGSTYNGKGDGAFLDYGFESGAGGSLTATGNVAMDCRGDVGPYDAGGFAASTFFGAGTVLNVISNYATANDAAVIIGIPGEPDGSTVEAHFNRFFGNTVAIDTRTTSTFAENNWYGCNGGPVSALCDPVAAFQGGSVDYDPWLVLTASADAYQLQSGQSTTVYAVVTWNSDGVDTTGMGHIPDGSPITFALASGPGNVSPTSAGTVDGVATTTYNATAVGTAVVDETLDNETQSVTINIEQGLYGGPGIPTLAPLGMILLVLIVAGLGLWAIRR